jgi:hypothetical protein
MEVRKMSGHRNTTFRGVWFAGLLLGIGLYGGSLSAESVTVFLKNGVDVEGTIVEENSNVIVIKTASGKSRSFNKKSEVDYVVKKEVEAAIEDPKVADSKTDVKPDVKTDTKAGDTPADPAVAAKDPAKTDAKADEKNPDGTPKKKPAVTVPGLASFPANGKRMSEDKEKTFMAALNGLASGDDEARKAAKAQISALGVDALPYLVGGIQHNNVETRSDCMSLIPSVGAEKARSAIKAVIEVFYRAMPEPGTPIASWQVPFIRAIKSTLPLLTGQTFITVDEDRPGVQDGLAKYIEWYDANSVALPEQYGEEETDPTDPEYAKKLTAARKLKKLKTAWIAPKSTVDLTRGTNKNNDRPDVPAGAGERPEDKAFRDRIPTVKRNDAFKRDVDR